MNVLKGFNFSYVPDALRQCFRNVSDNLFCILKLHLIYFCKFDKGITKVIIIFLR